MLVNGVPQGSVHGPFFFSIYTTFQPDDPTIAARISSYNYLQLIFPVTPSVQHQFNQVNQR